MKDWQKKVIRDNFSVLTDNTECDDDLLNHLTFLIPSEREECRNKLFKKVTRATNLYDLSMKRTHAYKILIEALHSTKQDVAEKILMDELKLKEPMEWEKLQKKLNLDDLDGATGSNPKEQVEHSLVPLETLRTDPELRKEFPDEILNHLIDGTKLEINFKAGKEKNEKDSDDKQGAIYLPKDASKGSAAIFNIVDFDGRENAPRESSKHDVINLKNFCYEIGYEWFPTNKRQLEGRRKTKEDLQQLIAGFKAECEKKKPASIIFFLGSHGDYHKDHGPRVCTSDLHDINVSDIIKEFHRSKCPPALQKIPKLFLIQACQDIVGERDAGLTEDSEEYNIIIFQSTSPGGSAYRTPYFGSWHVLCFLSAMMQHARNKHLLEILEIAKGKMELLRRKKVIPLNQQPSLEHFTLKDIYLNI